MKWDFKMVVSIVEWSYFRTGLKAGFYCSLKERGIGLVHSKYRITKIALKFSLQIIKHLQHHKHSPDNARAINKRKEAMTNN